MSVLSLSPGAVSPAVSEDSDLNDKYAAVKKENSDLEIQLKMLVEEKKQVCAHLQADCNSAQQNAQAAQVELEKMKVMHDDLLARYQAIAAAPPAERAPWVVSDVSALTESLERHSPSIPISELSVQYEILMQEKKTVCLKLDEQKERNRELRGQIQDMGRVLEEANEKVNDLTAQCQQLQMESKLLAEEKRDICKKMNSVKHKLESEMWASKQKVRELEDLNKEIRDLKMNVTELLVVKEKIEQDLLILGEQKTAADDALAGSLSDNRNLVAITNVLRQELRALKEANSELQFHLDENVFDKRAAKKEASTLESSQKAEIEGLQKQVEKLREECKDLKEGLDAQDKQIQEL
jgi:DNA repair exonuclease SbcCD ATPase subunit